MAPSYRIFTISKSNINPELPDADVSFSKKNININYQNFDGVFCDSLVSNMLIYIIFSKKSHTLNIPFQKCMKMQPLEP